MSTLNQQTLADSGANERPPMLERGNYILWESRFISYDVTSHVRYLRLMGEFDKFAAKEGESLELVYERLTTLVNIMDLQFEPHVLASKATKAAKSHDPLALLTHSNASSSQSHANSSYSSQPYYVTHPSSVVDYEDEYQGELQGDSQEDKLTTAMMLLARAITQKFSTPTNNHLHTSSNVITGNLSRVKYYKIS
ncbi:hypothetical protein Tco_0753426 [Tanacetum coccineum]